MAEKKQHQWDVIISGGDLKTRRIGPFSHRVARSAALEHARSFGRDVTLFRKSDGHTISPRFPELDRRRRV